MRDLIETSWNVKIKDGQLIFCRDTGFNRDIVECKGSIAGS